MVRAQKQGNSLIVLIVTIIVIIILAAVVILTLTKNNPIESAKEARFKEDIRTFQDELAMTVSKQYANAGGKRDTKINADKYTKDGAEDSVYTYIPSFKDKYNGKFVIQDDELKYTRNLADNEVEFLSSLNVKKYCILPKEFQQVEYLESTGTQWIDTNKKYYDIGKIQIKFMIKKRTNTVFGRNSAGREVLLFYQGGRDCYINGVKYTVEKEAKLDQVYEVIFDITNGNASLTINGELIGTSSGSSNSSNNYLMQLFRADVNNYQRIYSFECTDNEGNKMFNFIPCYSTTAVKDVNGNDCPNGTRGMYDLVEGKFYTNQGTGEFIVGPDV